MEIKVTKEIRVELSPSEYDGLEEDLTECHVGFPDEHGELVCYSNLADLNIYLDNAEMANLENDTTDIVRKAVEAARKENAETINFYWVK